MLHYKLDVGLLRPGDAADLPGMIDMLAELKHVQAPILVHVKTVKGHGYEVCTDDPTKMHSPAAFQVNGCARVERSRYVISVLDLAW